MESDFRVSPLTVTSLIAEYASNVSVDAVMLSNMVHAISLRLSSPVTLYNKNTLSIASGRSMYFGSLALRNPFGNL